MWGQEAPTLLFPQILEVGFSSNIAFHQHFSPGYEAEQGVIELLVMSTEYEKNPARKTMTMSIFVLF